MNIPGPKQPAKGSNAKRPRPKVQRPRAKGVQTTPSPPSTRSPSSLTTGKSAPPPRAAPSREDAMLDALFGPKAKEPQPAAEGRKGGKALKGKGPARKRGRSEVAEVGVVDAPEKADQRKRPRPAAPPLDMQAKVEADATTEEGTEDSEEAQAIAAEVRENLDILTSVLGQQQGQAVPLPALSSAAAAAAAPGGKDAITPPLAQPTEIPRALDNSLVQPYHLSATAKHKVGKFLALDCEMVGVGADGVQSILARVSLVNFHGELVYDTYVACAERITDFRTHVSGITPALLRQAPPFATVQQHVADLIKDRVVVGHALRNDFQALLLHHPFHMCRDTSVFKPFRDLAKGKRPSLKRLAKELLGMEIQGAEHSSIEDARAAMLLYRKYRAEWEAMVMTSSLRGGGRKAA